MMTSRASTLNLSVQQKTPTVPQTDKIKFDAVPGLNLLAGHTNAVAHIRTLYLLTLETSLP